MMMLTTWEREDMSSARLREMLEDVWPVVSSEYLSRLYIIFTISSTIKSSFFIVHHFYRRRPLDFLFNGKIAFCTSIFILRTDPFNFSQTQNILKRFITPDLTYLKNTIAIHKFI